MSARHSAIESILFCIVTRYICRNGPSIEASGFRRGSTGSNLPFQTCRKEKGEAVFVHCESQRAQKNAVFPCLKLHGPLSTSQIFHLLLRLNLPAIAYNFRAISLDFQFAKIEKRGCSLRLCYLRNIEKEPLGPVLAPVLARKRSGDVAGIAQRLLVSLPIKAYIYFVRSTPYSGHDRPLLVCFRAEQLPGHSTIVFARSDC
jgi:hypothetical protein